VIVVNTKVVNLLLHHVGNPPNHLPLTTQQGGQVVALWVIILFEHISNNVQNIEELI
jgi:hypothetical protein